MASMASTSRVDADAPEPRMPPASISIDAAHEDAPPRLFIVCGRDRKAEDLREMFGACGAIRHFHLATDRSNKSRGFAFLQYEDAASADEAIKMFDQMTLSDGHILKVTIAREKTASDSLSSHKPPGKLKRNQHHEEENENEGAIDDADGMLPGKRQRSSPPATAAIKSVWMQSAVVNKLRDASHTTCKTIGACSNDSPAAIKTEISLLLSEMVATVERMAAPSPSPCPTPSSGNSVKRKATPDDKSSRQGESPAETLSSRINSVKLDSDPIKPKSQRLDAFMTPTRRSRREFASRQRHSIDESDSSLDDGSDASVGRRKRSITGPDGIGVARRRLSDLSELSLSPSDLSVSASPPPKSSTTKKHRSSHGSGSHDVTYHHPPQYFPHFQPSTVSPPILQSAQPQLRSRLFFTATFKFTLQELRAMFSVYGDIETVQIVPSFGKIKTMAYIKYASASTAHNVLSSFMEEQDEASAETMKLTYADDDEVSTPAFPQRRATPPAPAAGESTSSEDISGYYPEPLTSDERCWVLILYHSDLTNEEISSCVDDSDGFQFLDIKMFRSTGRPQGVAFARFDTEETAQAASQNLHNLEFPTESQRYLQAMVISDPSLFSTPHTVSVDNGPNSRRPHSGEDGDLGAVEARFAHLMSSGEQPQRSTSVAAVAVPTDEDVHYAVPAHPSVPMGPPPAQPPYMVNHGSSHYEFSPFAYQYPPASSHPFSYPPQVWSYDAPPVHPPWMAHSPGPMQPQFGSFAWGPPSNGYFEFGQTETSATEEASSVFISSSRPVDLSALMAVLKDCSGVVGFAKEERAFVVDFSEPRLAVETARKLDGTMCNGQKLRVTIAGSHRPPPSRRKRQRLDGRARK